MSKEKELVKNTAIITFGKVCTQLVSFLLLPLYTSILSTEEYGTVDLVITYSTLLLPFITLALEQALFRFLIDARGNKEKTCQYISTTVYISGIILSGAVAVILGIYIFTGNQYLPYFALVLGGSVVSAISLQICRGLGDNIGYTLCSITAAIVQIAGNVLFIAVFKFGAQGMMLASFLGYSASGVIPFVRCRLTEYLKLRYFNKETFTELIRYSLPLIPNQLSWWVLSAADKVIVQFFIGISGNGLVAVASRFSGVYIQFSGIFNISWTESATLHIHDKDADNFFIEIINSVYKLFLSACCGIIVCIPFVFPVLINAQYNEAYGLIPIFMVASLCNVVVSLYGVIYVAHKKSVEIAKTAVYAATLNVVSHLLLIHFLGIYASAVSTAIGYGGMAVYRYFHSRKYLTVKFKKSTLFLSILMLAVSFGSYYSCMRIIEILGFLLIFVLSIVLNRRILFSIVQTVKKSKDNILR